MDPSNAFSSSTWVFIPVILLAVAVMYFGTVRPQKKRQQEKLLMLHNLKKGDRVVTIGGMHATVADLNDDEVVLRTVDNTKLVFERSAINAVLQEENGKNKIPAQTKKVLEKIEEQNKETIHQAKENEKATAQGR